MKTLLALSLVVLNSLVFFSCSKDNATTLRVKKAATEYFPNSIGNYWEYDVYDSSSSRDHPEVPREYIVKVMITGPKTLVDGRSALVWKYKFPWGNEIYYYRQDGDSVKTFEENIQQQSNNYSIHDYCL